MIDMTEQTLKEQTKDLQKECKDKDDKKDYYDMYDIYEVDCDDGTYGDKILVPKNKMISVKNKKKENE